MGSQQRQVALFFFVLPTNQPSKLLRFKILFYSFPSHFCIQPKKPFHKPPPQKKNIFQDLLILKKYSLKKYSLLVQRKLNELSALKIPLLVPLLFHFSILRIKLSFSIHCYFRLDLVGRMELTLTFSIATEMTYILRSQSLVPVTGFTL